MSKCEFGEQEEWEEGGIGWVVEVCGQDVGEVFDPQFPVSTFGEVS